MECHENCEYVQIALECGEEIRQEYNRLLDAYTKAKEYSGLLEQYVSYLSDCEVARQSAVLGEAEQLQNIPEQYWWPLISEHGLKLSSTRFQKAYPAIKARYQELFDRADLAHLKSVCGNVVAFPSPR